MVNCDNILHSHRCEEVVVTRRISTTVTDYE